jgi:hypothetical protein
MFLLPLCIPHRGGREKDSPTPINLLCFIIGVNGLTGVLNPVVIGLQKTSAGLLGRLNQNFLVKDMFKILNFNCGLFENSFACSFKIVNEYELFRSSCFDGRSQSQLFSHPFCYDSHCFGSLWRSQ